MNSSNNFIQGARRHDWVGLIISNLTTLLVAWFVFAGTQDTNQTQALEAAYAQIDSQGKQIIELREMYIQTQLQVVQLRAKLSEGVSEAELLQGYLDVLPFPAWIKQYNKDINSFTMIMINAEYTATYGITENQYIGKNDYDIYPKEIADQYFLNDKLVMESNDFIRTIETVILPNGEKKDIVIFKFLIKLPDGTIGIGGVSIDDNV